MSEPNFDNITSIEDVDKLLSPLKDAPDPIQELTAVTEAKKAIEAMDLTRKQSILKAFECIDNIKDHDTNKKYFQLIQDKAGQALHNTAEIAAAFNKAEKRANQKPNSWESNRMTVKQLMETELPPVKWFIEGLIPEGFTLLLGKPKIGKSFLLLMLGLAVSRGQDFLGFKTEKSDVLYLALEDSFARLQERLESIVQYDVDDSFHIITKWQSLDHGCIDDLKSYTDTYPDIGLILVDTYQKIKGSTGSNRNEYEKEYEIISILKEFAAEKNIALLIVHHSKKDASSKDFIDHALGSTALTGAADTIIGLSRPRGEDTCKMFVTGRDVRDADYSIKFDQLTKRWELVGAGFISEVSPQRLEIIELLKESPLSPKDIAIKLNKRPGTIRLTLRRMYEDGHLKKIGNLYSIPELVDPRYDPDTERELPI